MEPPDKICLLKTLERLEEAELRAFKDQLSVIQPKKGYERIPLERLQNADCQELIDLLVQYYGMDYGPEMTMEILRLIEPEFLPEKLVDSQNTEEHLVGENQAELIQRVSSVPEVLNRLLGVALSDDQYNVILSEPTDVLRMQKLYGLVPSWNKENKDHLYQVLQETNGPLIEELKGGHFVERHEAVLIHQVSGVDCVLQQLLHFSLAPDQYEAIRAEQTDRQKMKMLYKLVPNWDVKSKDRLYQALLETNPQLLRAIEGGHFVEQHHEELIQQVCQMDVILFRLLGFALKHDEYDRIMDEETESGKMQKLLELVPSWDGTKKDRLYQELIQTNGPLIAALQGASKPENILASPNDGGHFIERHQEELIRRVIGMDMVLCHLLWHSLITVEQMWEIKMTDQHKMRKLYRLMASWSTADKDQMQDILTETNRWLIAQLAGGHFVDRHKEDLIERMTEVPLSELHGVVLDEEEYETLANCATEKMKMEALFQIGQGWDRKKKDRLYQVLAETNTDIIEMLAEEHFVEKHQEELIHRVSRIDATLRRLQNQCCLNKEGSGLQKMEELYKLVPAWNRKQKDAFYEVLKKTNGSLIAELEEGHFVERHKEELIQRVTRVADVVQLLRYVTIHHHLYIAILEKHTEKEKLEMLYEVVPYWNGDLKDRLYQALRTTNEDLIEELEGRECSKEGIIPDPLAAEKCYMCEREQDFPEVQPELVRDDNGELKTYRIHFAKAGKVLCSVTELMFEVKAAVTLEYTYGSWDMHLSEAEKQQWMVAGPLFGIQADPAGEVAAVHLPHFLCLKEGQINISQMKIAHVVDGRLTLKEPSCVTPSYVVLEHPRFSFLGVICEFIYEAFKFFPIHSVVQLYRARSSSETSVLHLYLIPNDSSLIQAIKNDEEGKDSVLVSKPPQTDEPLHFGSHYFVSSSAGLLIWPEKLTFSYKSPGQQQDFAEIHLKKKEQVKLSLEKKKNLSIWNAWLKPEEVLTKEDHHAANTEMKELAKAPTKAPKTIQDLLRETLENLEAQELKKFKHKLNEYPVQEDCENIPKGKLENADALDLCNLLDGYYGEDYAVQVAADVLKAVNCKRQAEKLLTSVYSLPGKKPHSSKESEVATIDLEGPCPSVPRRGRTQGSALAAGCSSQEQEDDIYTENSEQNNPSRILEGKIKSLLEECRKKEHRLEEQELESMFEKMWTETLLKSPAACLKKRSIIPDIELRLTEELSCHGTLVTQKLQDAKGLLSFRIDTFQMKTEYIYPSLWDHIKHFFVQKENFDKAEELAKSLMAKCTSYIGDTVNSKGDYDTIYCGELLRMINEKLQQSDVEKLRTTPSFEVDLKLHILGEAAHVFQKMHEDFIEENNLWLRLEKLEPHYFSIFKYLYLENNNERGRAKYFCDQCLQPALVDYVNKRLGIEIANHILKTAQSAEYGSYTFQYDLQMELLEDETVDNYMNYILSYEEFVKSWIWRQILKHYENNKDLKNLEDEILSAMLKKIRETLPNDAMTVSVFLDNFCQKMQELVFLKDSLVGAQFQNTSPSDLFSHWIDRFLPGLQENIQRELNALDTESKLSKLPEKPVDKIFKEAFGCGEQCPFCKVPCEAGGSSHEKHFAKVHWPKGLGGYREIQSGKLHYSLCTTDMASKFAFQNEDTAGKPCAYTNYRVYYPNWCIDPDTTVDASNYWKFVFKKFNHKFAHQYHAEPADLPENWKKLTKEQALKALKETYSTILCTPYKK